MYPNRELKRLAARKTELRLRLGHSRRQIQDAAALAARPFALLDRALAIWRCVRTPARAATILVSFFAWRARRARARESPAEPRGATSPGTGHSRIPPTDQ
jgi:hypothetical protein